jgi:V/A-type H+-transporting ATPase subunit D
MLAAAGGLPALVKVKKVALHEEMVLGVRLPVLDEIEFESRDYGFLSTPAWTEGLIDDLRATAAMTIRHRIDVECIRRMDSALARTVQRINLFEKILVPSTLSRIRKIEIFLQDGERAAIVSSKMAKRRHLQRHAAAGVGYRS